ncbi:hypothetical protein TcCL_NonESM00172 [Trypanosoma cruzi]|uniref:Uncharacterized protein n=1 Tax=Trypanosoma cruzi (strain CL Brener) TaxID=353153 RepID=Q4D2Q0_TRYCC|nr:hypothetical protein Tc00.1047053507005.50 [Trypanosoma cruzi]EAN86803.1 hypothetical protein Tc00.1047053507005.50 [Trypanosoma cruzi]RNC49849.1 hypothetical protein TcCL_NonESM00172 [Trypanosoma cruzi]|eukprot:XP_808654.1 hypothetical protein [Trypanosoma cruzi strain CL Brener]
MLLIAHVRCRGDKADEVMDAKEAFDEIRAHFAMRSQFSEAGNRLSAMVRRFQESLQRQDGSDIQGVKGARHVQQRPSKSSMQKLPPPIFRPAAVEALLHYASPLPVRTEEGKDVRGGASILYNDKENDMRSNRIGDDYLSHKCVAQPCASGEGAFQGKRDSFSSTPVAFLSSGRNQDQPVDVGAKLSHNDGFRSRYTHEASAARSSQCILRKEQDMFPFVNGDSDGGTQKPNGCCEERDDALHSLGEFDGETMVDCVCHAMQKNKCQKSEIEEEKEKSEEENKKNDELRTKGMEEAPADTARKTTRSILADLDELEKTHHDAVAVMLMRTPLRPRPQKEQKLVTSDGGQRLDQHGAPHGIQHHVHPEQRATAVNLDLDVLSGSQALRCRPPNGPIDVSVSNRGTRVPSNLGQGNVKNVPYFVKGSSSVLNFSSTSSSDAYDAKDKWLNVSFL